MVKGIPKQQKNRKPNSMVKVKKIPKAATASARRNSNHTLELKKLRQRAIRRLYESLTAAAAAKAHGHGTKNENENADGDGGDTTTPPQETIIKYTIELEEAIFEAFRDHSSYSQQMLEILAVLQDQFCDFPLNWDDLWSKNNCTVPQPENSSAFFHSLVTFDYAGARQEASLRRYNERLLQINGVVVDAVSISERIKNILQVDGDAGLKCSECGMFTVVYKHMQLRGADEAMSTLCQCMNPDCKYKERLD